LLGYHSSARRTHSSADTGCTDSSTPADPDDPSYTSAYASAGATSVLLQLRLHRRLCYDRVVRWERECVLRLWWELVRISSPSSHTGSHTSGANAAGSPAGSHHTGAHTASVLLRLWLHGQLCYDRMVRWERECMFWLWWGLVRISPSSDTGSYTSCAANAISANADADGTDAAGAQPSPGVLCMQEPLLGFLC